MMILLNPNITSGNIPMNDPAKLCLNHCLLENKGKSKIKEHDRERVWYEDLLEFNRENEIFYTLLTRKDTERTLPLGYLA